MVVTTPSAPQIKQEQFNPKSAKGFAPPPPATQQQRVAFRVFLLTAEILVFALVMFFVLVLWGMADLERFATSALSPIVTVFAGATGYYFGGTRSDPSPPPPSQP